MSGVEGPTPPQNAWMPPPVPSDSTRGAEPPEVRAKFSATRVAKGKTVEEPAAQMPARAVWLPADWSLPQAPTARRAIADAAALESELDHIPGVVANGLFARRGADVALLARKGRASELPDVVVAFAEALNRERNIMPATITTAVEIDPSVRSEIEAHLKSVSGKGVDPHYKIDPALIGGFQARFATFRRLA